uniref:ZP domain-containing protein n=1 Tax=Heterorhabditis bacteriophora TaxID=37862 RepID=A0A1I7WLX8_HETBA
MDSHSVISSSKKSSLEECLTECLDEKSQYYIVKQLLYIYFYLLVLTFKGNEMILEVVLSTDGVEPLYFITPDDLTFQAKCSIMGRLDRNKQNRDGLKIVEDKESKTNNSTSVSTTKVVTQSTKGTSKLTSTKWLTSSTAIVSTLISTTAKTSSPSTTTSTTSKVVTSTIPSTSLSPITTTKNITTMTTTALITQHISKSKPSTSHIETSSLFPVKPVKGSISFDIFHNGQPVEPIDSKYEWEREPLPIIREGCQADLVGLVCPPRLSEFGIKVTVESFRYQTTPQVQYSCLVRVCPFAPCPQLTCPDVEGCPTNEFGRTVRSLSLEDIRRALEDDPKLASQIGIPPSVLSKKPGPSGLVLILSIEQQLLALAGDYTVKRRLVVVNSEDQLRYYVRTGDIP